MCLNNIMTADNIPDWIIEITQKNCVCMHVNRAHSALKAKLFAQCEMHQWHWVWSWSQWQTWITNTIIPFNSFIVLWFMTTSDGSGSCSYLYKHQADMRSTEKKEIKHTETKQKVLCMHNAMPLTRMSKCGIAIKSHQRSAKYISLV